jgi:uncharacterized membrane protein YdcZ (DUF606 family)
VHVSLPLDRQGWLRFAAHPVNTWRVVDAALLRAGVVLIVRH